MASVNKVIVLGNLGMDPTVRYNADGGMITSVSLATSESWKDKASGEKKEATEWHRLVFFGKLAEIAGEYLKKGTSIYAEGKLKTRKWTDKEGGEKYTTEIIVDVMKMLGGGGERDATPRAATPSRQKPATPGFDDMEDDIPF